MAQYTTTGRTAKPLLLKLNPVWWFANDDDPPPEGYSAFGWWLRNPMHNLMFYVLGVADRNYTVYGRDPVNIGVRADIGQEGWHNTVILAGGWLPLPYVSYSNSRFTFYLGWQPSGRLGAKVNIHRN